MPLVYAWLGGHTLQQSTIIGQSDGDLRLVPVDIDHIGRLETFLNGTWGTVCKRGFDIYEGNIACKELGFLYAYRFNDVHGLG